MSSDDATRHVKDFLDRAGQLEHTQRALLLEGILRDNRDSLYGRAYDFAAIDSLEAFRERVPLVDYEGIREWVDRVADGESGVLTTERTLAFFRTSGSLAKPKLVPVTTSLMRQKVAAFATYWEKIYTDYPAIRDGAVVSNFSDASNPERLPSGLDVHSESGFWARRGRSLHTLQRWPLPAEVRLLEHSKARSYATARLLLQGELHCIMCLNPSTLLQFCRRIETDLAALADGLDSGRWGARDPDVVEVLEGSMAEPLSAYLSVEPRRAELLRQLASSDEPLALKSLWPELDLAICWCSPVVQPYFVQLAPYLDGVPVRDYITQSSECIMALPLEDGSSGGVLASSMHFFEFIPEAEVDEAQPRTRLAWELEIGERYEVVVTTGGGLYRYRMGDCVEVRAMLHGAPVIEFLYRLGKTSSMTGEKLTEYQVIEAGRRASRILEVGPDEYLSYPCDGHTPHYATLVDIDEAVDAAGVREWVETFDRCLADINPEYGDKQASGRLGAMQAHRVVPGALLASRHAKKPIGVSNEQVKAEVLSSRHNLHLQYELLDDALPRAS